MKYIYLLLFPILLSGCIIDHIVDYKPHASLSLENIFWTAEGSEIIVNADSISSNGDYHNILRIYSKDGNLIQSFIAPSDLRNFNPIFGSVDDSTFYFSFYSGSSYDNYFTARYSFSGQWISTVAGGAIYGQSTDRKHLFIGPSGYTNVANNYLVVDVSGSASRLQKSWFDYAPQVMNAVWIGNKGIGYFHYNPLNIVEFLITDTNGSKLDSLDISGLSDREIPYYGPGAFYFAGYDGITKIDSASKTSSNLTQDYIGSSDMSSDGSFITYVTITNSDQLNVINAKTGTVKKLADHVSPYLKISPSNDHVAYIDESDSYTQKLVIIPVSAP